MSTVNSRIKELREFLGLSQQNFADQVQLQRNTISLIENAARNPSDRSLRDICNAFKVNESWLKTGEGNMFIEQTLDEQFIMLLADIENSENDDLKKLIKKISYLNLEHLNILNMLVDALIKKENE